MTTWMVDHYIQVNRRLMANTVLNFQICLSLIKWTSFIEKSYQNWTKVWPQNEKFWNFIKYLGLIHTEFLVIGLVLVTQKWVEYPFLVMSTNATTKNSVWTKP